jgi:hypothetical protein
LRESGSAVNSGRTTWFWVSIAELDRHEHSSKALGHTAESIHLPGRIRLNPKLLALGLLLSLSTTVSQAQDTPPPPLVATPQADVHPEDMPPRFSQHEDWSALALAKSGLNPAVYVAVVLSKTEEPDYTRELIRVQWRTADPIDLYVVKPRGPVKSPAILYLYDYRFDTERFRDDGWCKRATQGGFAAVGFGSALSRQRFHSRPMKEWFVSELQEALGESTHDVQMVLNYVSSRGDIDMNRIGMFAQGSGGAIAVLAAAVDSRITVLDLLNPWGDWPDWLKESPQIPEDERSAYLVPEFLSKVAGLDPVSDLPRLHLKALRVEQIMDDPVTPPSAKDKLSAAVGSADSVVRYKDASAHLAAWRASGISGWIRDQLTPSTAQASNAPTR